MDFWELLDRVFTLGIWILIILMAFVVYDVHQIREEGGCHKLVEKYGDKDPDNYRFMTPEEYENYTERLNPEPEAFEEYEYSPGLE